MGGGGGKSGQAYDNSLELYRQQQADLARQKAEEEAKEKAAAEAEQAKRDKLRQQMLGEAISTDDEEENMDTSNMAIQKNTLA